MSWTPALPSTPAQATTPAHVSGTAVAGSPLHPSQHANDKEDLPAGAQMCWPSLNPAGPVANLYAPGSHAFDTGIDHRQHTIQMLNHPGVGFGYVNLLNGLEYFDGLPPMPAGVDASPSSTYNSSYTSHGTPASDPFANAGSYYPYGAFAMPVASPPLGHSHVGPPVVDSPFITRPLHASHGQIQDLDDGFDYVSPEKLRINPSPVPLAPRFSSESVLSDSVTHTKPNPGMGHNPFEGDFPPPPLRPSTSRKGLPDRPRPRARLRPAQASGPSQSSSSRSPLAGSSDCLPASSSSSSPSPRRSKTTASKHHSTLAHRSKMADLKPKPANLGSSPRSERLEKDDYLIKAREAGKTYKEIREQGNFREAESTLRGRYRTLTKHKDERVRKPEWEDKDVSVSLAVLAWLVVCARTDQSVMRRLSS